MLVGAVADIHGNFEALTRGDGTPSRRAALDLRRRRGQPHGRISVAAARRCSGSRATTRTSSALPPGKPARRSHPTSTTFATARPRTSGRLRVAGLGGTYAPKWFETRAADLPPGRRDAPFEKRDDKRRHFVRAGSRGVQAACADRYPDDARGGASVHRRGRSVARTKGPAHRCGQAGHQRACSQR